MTTMIRQIELTDPSGEVVKLTKTQEFNATTAEKKRKALIIRELLQVASAYGLDFPTDRHSELSLAVLRYYSDFFITDVEMSFEYASKIGMEIHNFGRGLTKDLLLQVLRAYSKEIRPQRKQGRVLRTVKEVRTATRTDTARSFAQHLSQLSLAVKSGKNIDDQVYTYQFNFIKKKGVKFSEEQILQAAEQASISVKDQIVLKRDSGSLKRIEAKNMLEALERRSNRGQTLIDVQQQKLLLKGWLLKNEMTAEELEDFFLKSE